MIEIVNSEFITSAPTLEASPENEYQNEIVFIARSNTGKSSLLNALSQRKSLAKVSSTPGKTRLINYFDVTFIDRENDQQNIAKFVDLPGFGYAKLSKSIKKDWEKNLTNFVQNRKNIKLFLHLIDCRHPRLEIDKSVDEFISQIIDESQVHINVFTKIDKLNQKEISKLKREYPGSIMISNTKKKGINQLVKIIYTTLFDEIIEDEVID